MLNTLNPAQRDAVTTLSGPLLVLAGAGTGKTRVITFRIANLIKHRVKPERILAVTFTNKAAREMRQRAMGLLGKKRKSTPEISTFHSLCVRILRRHLSKLGYPAKFAIYDRSDQESIARSVLRELRVPGESLRPGDLISIIGGWKSRGVRPQQAANLAEDDKEHLAAAGYRRYQNALKAAGAVDFDDLLMCTCELFRKFPEVRVEESQRFDHLLIDEYQDTNGLQYQIVKVLAAPHRNLCVVGDDDQSIYGWRGAEVEHILHFKRDWPEAKVVRLEENYRSTAPILDLANRLIAFNKTRHDKILRPTEPDGRKPEFRRYPDEEAEAVEVVSEIEFLVAEKICHWRDIAILFRTNEQPRMFEAELRRANVPYVLIGGMSFYDRREVRDMLAYLKVLSNPSDEVALLRILNTPARGIGDAARKVLMQEAVNKGTPLWNVLHTAEQNGDIPWQSAQAAMAFHQLIEEYRERMNSESLVEVFRDLVFKIDYAGHLAQLYSTPSDVESRWQAIEEIMNALGGYEERAKKPTLEGFLDDVALSDREDESDNEKQLDRDAVVLMTLHSAKGLEFPHVYLVGMEEGFLPHRRSIAIDGTAIEEERRLCYVGVTRAQQVLTVTHAQSRMKWGRRKSTFPSRFLYEMQGAADNPQLAAVRTKVVTAAVSDLQKAEAQRAKQAKSKATKSKSDGRKKKTKRPVRNATGRRTK